VCLSMCVCVCMCGCVCECLRVCVCVCVCVYPNSSIQRDVKTDISEKYYRVKEERNSLRTIITKANWIGHILHMNCLLKHVTEGKI